MLKNFYDTEKYIKPFLEKIDALFDIINSVNCLSIKIPPFSEKNFDEIYYKILSCDRRLGGVIYDMIKQLPEFVYITALPKNWLVAQQLCESLNIGIVGGGVVAFVLIILMKIDF